MFVPENRDAFEAGLETPPSVRKSARENAEREAAAAEPKFDRSYTLVRARVPELMEQAGLEFAMREIPHEDRETRRLYLADLLFNATHDVLHGHGSKHERAVADFVEAARELLSLCGHDLATQLMFAGNHDLGDFTTRFRVVKRL